MSSAPILYQEHDFMKRTHGYEVTQLLSGIGGKLTRFQKDSREYKIILSVWRDDMYDTLNWMTDIFDRDVAEKVPGKLFVNDEYLQCYIVGSDVKNWTLSRQWRGRRVNRFCGKADMGKGGAPNIRYIRSECYYRIQISDCNPIRFHFKCWIKAITNRTLYVRIR